MSDKTEYPVLHGDQHLPDGSDPIPNLFGSGGEQTYRDRVLAEPSLWGFWPLDDDDGTTELHNLADAAYPLDVHDDPGGGYELTYEQPGPFTTGDELGILFEGTTAVGNHGTWGQVSATSFPSIAGTTYPFTFECWAYPTTTSAAYIVSAGALSGKLWNISHGTGGVSSMELTASRGGDLVGATGVILDLNAWYHLALTYDSTTLRLYANGVLAGSVASGAHSPVSDILFVGGLPQATLTAAFFTGRLSLAAWYSAALDADTIADHAGTSDDGTAAAGKVRVADGTGGTTWEFPLEITY